MVYSFCGVLLLSAKCPRPPGRRGNSVWKTIRRTIQRTNNSFGSNGWISSDFNAGFFKTSSIWQESVNWYLSWSCWRHQGGENFIFYRRWYSKFVRNRLQIARTHSEAGTTCKELRSQRRSSRRTGRVFNRQKQKMTLKPGKTSGRFQVTSFIAITLNHEFSSMCRKEKLSPVHWNTLMWPGRHTHPWMYCWRKYWRFLERGWRQRVVRCMDRLHKIHFIEREATWRIHMVGEETYKETNNLSSRWCMARYVEANVWCSQNESKTKMGYRETKTWQCQTIEVNILHWTKQRRIQAHNESRS